MALCLEYVVDDVAKLEKLLEGGRLAKVMKRLVAFDIFRVLGRSGRGHHDDRVRRQRSLTPQTREDFIAVPFGKMQIKKYQIRKRQGGVAVDFEE